jgi:uncharacterized RDD family membrane protein YckC
MIRTGDDGLPKANEFVADHAAAPSQSGRQALPLSCGVQREENDRPRTFDAIECGESTRETELVPAGSSIDWREEVAARLNKYQSRRKRREPRYPSLRLKFDPPEYTRPPLPEPALANTAIAAQRSEAAVAPPNVTTTEQPGSCSTIGEPVNAAESNVIEFPRLFIPEAPPADQLAEPLVDKPRILEAPEAVPKQVPLGGIVIQTDEEPAVARADLPLPVAPIPLRVLAGALDMVIVTLGMIGFLGVVFHFTQVTAPAHDFLLVWLGLPCCLWIAYQYGFLVYTGTTPGLSVARLQLRRFDGTHPGRTQRRSRALALILSAGSMGLGFLWALIDEDTLCWHDRITRTFFAMAAKEHSGFLLRIFGPDSKLHRLLQDRIPQPPVS